MWGAIKVTCEDKMWSEFNEFMRSQKHWMLNQFQIIMGYIQIGKTDLAFEFIKRATSEVEGTSIFTQLPNEEIGVRACMIWWKMRENNFTLFPIIDKGISLNNTAKVFEELSLFMDNIMGKYFKYLTDKHITWKLIQQDNTLTSVLKTDEEIILPNLYDGNEQFLGKVKVEGNTITYIIQD